MSADDFTASGVKRRESRNRRKARPVSDHAIMALHKYYLRAQHMRLQFHQARDDFVKKYGKIGWRKHASTTEYFLTQMYLDFWYATLFVTLEGYEKLGLHNTVIENILSSPLQTKLRSYRAGTYHFREKYFDDDIRNFLTDKTSGDWISSLDMALGTFLLSELRTRRIALTAKGVKHRRAASSGPLMDAIFQTQLGHQYSRVMEGIGRIALAVSFLEFSVDGLGWSLTSDLQVYHALTGFMSVASKANRLVELAKQVLLDEELLERTVDYCKGVLPLLEGRNRAVHSLYSVEEDGIIQFKAALKHQPIKTVEAEEFFDLADKIWDFIGESKTLQEDVRQYRENMRVVLTKMSQCLNLNRIGCFSHAPIS
jgi:hypothetical protein